MPRKFSYQETAKINKDLIISGIDMFSKFGVQNVTVDQLVSKVGISKGAFYHFYESKLGLYTQVIIEIQKTIDNETRELIESLSKRPEQILIALVKYSKLIHKRYAMINQGKSYMIDGLSDVRISGEIVIDSLHSMKAVCDFSSEAIEALLARIGTLSFTGNEREGQELLFEVLDTGFSVFIRY